MVKEYSNGRMGKSIMENGQMILSMEKVFTSTKTVECMKVILVTIYHMVMAN